jgi:hypothetical protein
MNSMKISLFPNLISKKMKMIITLLPNDRIPKLKKRRYITAAIKKVPTRINVEYKVNSSISQ